jgi:hypothetical protein
MPSAAAASGNVGPAGVGGSSSWTQTSQSSSSNSVAFRYKDITWILGLEDCQVKITDCRGGSRGEKCNFSGCGYFTRDDGACAGEASCRIRMFSPMLPSCNVPSPSPSVPPPSPTAVPPSPAPAPAPAPTNSLPNCACSNGPMRCQFDWMTVGRQCPMSRACAFASQADARQCPGYQFTNRNGIILKCC